VDHRVAVGARRKLCRPGVDPVHSARAHWAMALVAQRVDVRHVEEPRILRSVRCVAAQATFTLDSYTKGPRVSVWHFVQIAFWSAVDFRLLLPNVPCTLWQSLQLTNPSFTLW
jgi:hypothetical protein